MSKGTLKHFNGLSIMKSSGIASIVVIAAICITVALIGIASDKYLGPDNEVEQIAEKVIEDETGIDVDLSPEKSNSK